DRSFTSEKFLSDYVQAVPLSSLHVNNGRHATTPPHAGKQSSESFWRFGTLMMVHIVVNTDCLISTILKRLRCKGFGQWKISITRDIKQIEVDVAVESDVKHSYADDQHCIEIVGTTNYVQFTIQRNLIYPALWEFNAMFH
ncbi:hypothetical protein PENTCL1PPCAC_4362, partial [Pristionchus entomophagus]